MTRFQSRPYDVPTRLQQTAQSYIITIFQGHNTGQKKIPEILRGHYNSLAFSHR